MTNLTNTLGSFTIDDGIFDVYRWIGDGVIDNLAGVPCTLYYPPNIDECPNCFYDPKINRSSGIYKTGGPVSFTNFTLCPYCHGRGLLTTEPTENIKMRVYHSPSSFIDIGVDWKTANGVVMCIGYLKDLPKIENAIKILVNSDIEGIRKYFLQRFGEFVPWGLGTPKRYCLGYIERIN